MRTKIAQTLACSAMTVALLGAPAQIIAQTPNFPPIVVTGEAMPHPSQLTAGPEIKGLIAARNGNRIKVASADGSTNVIAVTDTTEIKASSGPLGYKKRKLGADALLNGLPVTVETMQSGSELYASQISFRAADYKLASMIRTGTAQGFADQTAATEALRGRMADIDKYNVVSTTNVYFDSGKATLSPAAKIELCNTASAAEATDNALLLVVGYTDSTGSDEVNQALSERRAASVINYLQQQCRWKPYRMLTPTGMATADPAASNDTPEGMAQNRRVAVNVLVSKALEGM